MRRGKIQISRGKLYVLTKTGEWKECERAKEQRKKSRQRRTGTLTALSCQVRTRKSTSETNGAQGDANEMRIDIPAGAWRWLEPTLEGANSTV